MLDEELGKNDGDFKTYTLQHIIIMKRPTNLLTVCLVGEVILPYSMYRIQNVIAMIASFNSFILFNVCILFHGIMIYDIIHDIVFYFLHKQMDVFDVAQRYKSESNQVIILAGKEYGSGSSRDWAAKGPYLQGVRAVIAESYERIHRSEYFVVLGM